MSDSKSIKVLVTGSTNGQFKDLFTKAKQIHEKYGPFDVHLCTGNFFGPDTTEEAIQELLGNQIDIPLMTYFIIGDQPFPPAVQTHIESSDGEVCSNLYYLGKQGILTTSEGLKIAFISGTQQPPEPIEQDNLVHYTAADAQKLCLAKLPVTLPPGVDFLLSYEWSKDVEQLSSLPSVVGNGKSSVYISEIAAALKPRYHFAASEQRFYEREPYKNIVSGFGAQEEIAAGHVTRFIGLGDAVNTDKQRWFYAFNLIPMSKASKEALETMPENATECPFVPLFSGSSKRKIDSNADDDGGSFFWGKDSKRQKPGNGYVCRICRVPGHYLNDCPQKQHGGNNSVPDGYICKICEQPGHFIKECPNRQDDRPRGEQPKLDACWFCLSNPKIEKHLIVSIGSELYATLAKGPLVFSKENSVPGGGHVLLIPITHYPTFGKIPAETQVETMAELEKYKTALRSLYDQHDHDLVLFEVSKESFRQSHAHIQIVPVPRSKSDQVEKIAREQAEKAGMDFIEKVPTNPEIPYFKLELPNGKSLVHLIRPKERFNVQFGRLVLANVLGKPEREDWKACSQTEAQEKEDTVRFKVGFKPFDFTS